MKRILIIIAILFTGIANTSEISNPNKELIEAAKNNDIDRFKAALKANANVNSIGEFSATALMWAAFNGNLQMIDLLIKAKANLNMRNFQDYTAAQFAAYSNHCEIVDLLLEGGAHFFNDFSLNSQNYKIYLSKKNMIKQIYPDFLTKDPAEIVAGYCVE